MKERFFLRFLESKLPSHEITEENVISTLPHTHK